MGPRTFSLPNPDNHNQVVISCWEEFTAVLKELPVPSVVEGMKHFISDPHCVSNPDTMLQAVLSHPKADVILTWFHHQGEFFQDYMVLVIKSLLMNKYQKPKAKEVITLCPFQNTKQVRDMQNILNHLAA